VPLLENSAFISFLAHPCSGREELSFYQLFRAPLGQARKNSAFISFLGRPWRSLAKKLSFYQLFGTPDTAPPRTQLFGTLG